MSISYFLRRPLLSAGIAVGLLAAGALLIWMILNQTPPGLDGEGIAFKAVWLAVILGFPLNVPLSVVVDWATPAIHRIPGVNVFHVMLLGVVANWVLLGWIAERIRVALKRNSTSVRSL